MDKKFIIGVFAAVAVSMAVVIVPWVYTFYHSTFSQDPASWGVFGDYFGGVLSTIISIFGFIAVIVTIKKQGDSIKAQLASIELDKETRDDEIYYRQALQCLEEALATLNDSEDGRVRRDRVAWLQSARLILTAKELSDKIISVSMCTTYSASEKLIRSRFQSRLDPISNPETMQPNYFSGPNWDNYVSNRPSHRLEKHSVYIVYKFTSWGRDEVDLIDSIVGNVNIDDISPAYFGAAQYLNSQGQV
ncbi:hypothetical protein CXQ81_12575 [Pseudomonas sp. 09C 129]|uniref:hypothetical protein n=1 Tax=Pseudomonas sp. 09C 129 TaxID=2054915 RepID=UPI000C6CD41E|nr:hypothetical protein [Pseudomonas sp. 09C 129]AUG01403.1 hypothetical protein CXQ81_12575 [Pseudomonas sp. 09C 129]